MSPGILVVGGHGKFDGVKRQSGEPIRDNRRFDAVVRSKDRFVAEASHELRNVLAPIVTSLDALTHFSANEAQIELLTIAAEHARQLSRLVDDLVEASRLASGKVQLHPQTIDARSIVERSVAAVTSAIAKRRQEVLVNLCDGPLWLHADPLRLEQVFLNLLNNAIKFTPDTGCIWLQLDRDNTAAIFRIRDSGCGIRPELLPNIFDLYSQADDGNGRVASDGLGIGLAMVKSLVEMHGGSVAAHSDGLGCGADFTVRLPLHR